MVEKYARPSARSRELGAAFAEGYGEMMTGFADKLRAQGRGEMPDQNYAARELAKLQGELIRNELQPAPGGMLAGDAVRKVQEEEKQGGMSR
ncbi:MAG TPA: hypothetical protein VFB14_24145 [Bryobacteraceae bacterium]|jgi:hypothetical protein|nr:hypothetical protein [Bryobacteraceae bacterium]